jgi:hypothetical protein
MAKDMYRIDIGLFHGVTKLEINLEKDFESGATIRSRLRRDFSLFLKWKISRNPSAVAPKVFQLCLFFALYSINEVHPKMARVRKKKAKSGKHEP